MPRISTPLARLHLNPSSVGFAVICMALLTACSTAPEYKYVTTVSGGQRMEFSITGAGPAHASERGLTVEATQFLPPRGGMSFLALALKNESGQELKNVLVEDVTEETPARILEDTAPRLTNGVWRGLSEPVRSVAPPFEWLAFLDSSNRVYRFTVTLADGKTVTLNQLSIFPGWMKEGMRRAFKAAEDQKEEEKKETKPQT